MAWPEGRMARQSLPNYYLFLPNGVACRANDAPITAAMYATRQVYLAALALALNCTDDLSLLQVQTPQRCGLAWPGRPTGCLCVWVVICRSLLPTVLTHFVGCKKPHFVLRPSFYQWSSEAMKSVGISAGTYTNKF
jgi:hypothetical protein